MRLAVALVALIAACGATRAPREDAYLPTTHTDVVTMPAPDADGDGIVLEDDVCPCEAEDVDGFEDVDGCPDPDNDHDRVPDVCDACPNEPETFNGNCDMDGCPDGCVPDLTETRIVILEQVSFARGSVAIRPREAPLLDAIAAAMRENPSLTLVAVVGTSDDHEPRHETLALRRARAVVDALIARGVESARLVAETGAAPDGPPETRRRVTFEVRVRNGEPVDPHPPEPPPRPPARECVQPACDPPPPTRVC